MPGNTLILLPAVDVVDGKAVRLVQGQAGSETDYGDALEAAGGPWEVYWTNPGMVPDPAKWRTQIFAPLAK